MSKTLKSLKLFGMAQAVEELAAPTGEMANPESFPA
jgi:hypothetical protein